MASRVKVIKSDIKSKSKKTLVENLVKHAFSSVINYPSHKDSIMNSDTSLEDLMK